jgi:four helix bundle protein
VKNFEFDFEQLKVYQKALDFIDGIFDLYRNMSQDQKIAIGSNLVRAGLSIANNLAEGNGKRSKKEKKRYFGISLDSTRECISVFNVLKRQHLIKEDQYKELRLSGKEITSMLWGLIDAN